MNDQTQIVINLVAEVLSVPPQSIPADASMQTLPDWDSLAQLNICLRMEEQFGVEMDMDAIASAVSIPALADLVSRR